MLSTVITIYIVSVILAIVSTILMERIPGNKLTIGDIMDEWPLIFIPFVNTFWIIFVVLVVGTEQIIRITKLDKLWERIMNIEI